MKRFYSLLLSLVLLLSCFGQVLADGVSEDDAAASYDEQIHWFEGMDPAEAVDNSGFLPEITQEDMDRWEDGEPVPAAAETRAVHAITIPTPYTDISTGAWYYNSAAICYEMGFITGTSATTFTPDTCLTRAELVTILFRIENTYRSRSGSAALDPKPTSAFKDVDKDSYYAKAVTWAYQNGIVNGVTKTEFAPRDLVTREQIAAICYRLYKVYHERKYGDAANLTSFTDYREISDYAQTAVAWAVDIGYMAGKGNMLCPKDPATRAEAAVFAERAYLLLLSNGVTRCSRELMEFIMEREGFASTPYWDYSQWSVGYGSRCGTKRDGSDVPSAYWNGISQSEAQLLLKTYLEDFAEYNVEIFESREKLRFTQQQFDAMTDFTYALGPLWMGSNNQPNQLTAWLKKPGTDLALMNALGVWCHVGGKVNTGTAGRRIREGLIYLYGDYKDTSSSHPSYAAVRYYSAESYLDNSYQDSIGIYVIGKPYTSLPMPEYRPLSGSAFKMFNGWIDPNGKSVNTQTIVSGTTTLTARWQ